MGQVYSNEVSNVDQNRAESQSSSPESYKPADSSSVDKPQARDAQQPASLEDLILEATAYGETENKNESLDEKAKKALECPCIADLRNGPCGVQFSEAFVCFLKSTAEEKGSDCVHPFVALQNCIKENPNAFSKDVLEDNEKEKEEEEVQAQEYKIYAPEWAKESKSKL